MKTILVFLFD